MKRLSVSILLASAALFCLCGCDFIRTLAGRPSSAEIAVLRADEKSRLEEQAAALAADSLRRACSDACDAFASEGVKVRKSSEIPALDGQRLEKGLYLAMGAFSVEQNALKLVSRVSSCGYGVKCLAYSNGFFLVAAIPSPDYAKLREGYLKIREEEFFPSDAWILECE